MAGKFGESRSAIDRAFSADLRGLNKVKTAAMRHVATSRPAAAPEFHPPPVKTAPYRTILPAKLSYHSGTLFGHRLHARLGLGNIHYQQCLRSSRDSGRPTPACDSAQWKRKINIFQSMAASCRVLAAHLSGGRSTFAGRGSHPDVAGVS